MIESLTIRNFQSHEKLTIKFDRRVTTIVGPTDSGKSAVVRALRWAATNRPSGEAFLQTGAERVAVVLRVDGIQIKRTRGTGGNSYYCNGENFKAFGSNVPDVVSQQLNLCDATFQQQHDAPFWFSLTAGDVSRQLNQIINLGVIDTTLSYLNSAVRSKSALALLTSDRVKAFRAEKRCLVYVPEMDEALREVQALEQYAVDLTREAASVAMAVREVSEYQTDHSRAANVAKRGVGVVGLGDAWASLAAQADLLTQLVRDAERHTAEAKRIVPEPTALTALCQSVQKLREECLLIDNLIAEANCAVVDMRRAKLEWKTVADEFDKAMVGRCPLCGNKIK